MSKKKNLTKNKKIRKQMLAASAAGLVLISSAASMGTSLAYAAEKNQLTTAATATASSLQTASNKPVNPSLMKWNVGEILPSTYSPKNNYSGQIAETVRGATFKLTFSFYRNPGSSLTANDIKIDVKGKNVRYERSQSMDQLNVQVTFQAEGANTDFSIKWPATGKGGMRKWCTTDFGKYTDVPESGIANRGKINNLLNGIYSTSGVFASDVTYTKINMVSELIKSDIPMDDNYQYASAYWFYFLTPFLTRAASDVTRIDDATAAVNRLFDSKQQPKPTNTQAQVTAAKVKVDLLPKCSKKTMLLEKVEIAQQALDPSGSEAAKVQAATEAVNALFNGETPKPENTQEQINAAKAKVEALKDGNTKTALLAKIQKAQQALDASAGEEAAKVQAATEAVNALFNGGTPKPENTQEQINAAKAKVEALKDGDTKTALLAKIQQAQQAFEIANQEKLKLDPYTLGDEYVTGTTTEDIKKFQLIVNGKTYEPGFKFISGNKFEVYIGSRVPVGTKEFTLKAFNHAGEQVASQVVQVRAVSLTVDKYNLGDEYMTGSCTGCTTKKFRLTVDGKVYNPGFKLTKGKFEIYVGGKITGSSKVVKLEALDNQDQVLAQQNVTIEKPRLNIDEYIRDSEYMTGTIIGKGVKKFKLVFNGTEIMPGSKITADNKFEIYVGNKIPVNVTTVKVVGLDEYGKEVTSQDVTIQAATLMIDKYVLGDEYMTGTFKGGIKKFKLTVDGKEMFPGFKIFNDNKFEVYIGNKITAASKSVALAGLDEAGNVLVSQQVPVIQSDR